MGIPKAEEKEEGVNDLYSNSVINFIINHSSNNFRGKVATNIQQYDRKNREVE
jgi:hypothetical protein